MSVFSTITLLMLMILGYSTGLICIDFNPKRISIIDLLIVAVLGALIFIDSIIQAIPYIHLCGFVVMFLIAYIKSLVIWVSASPEELRHKNGLYYSWIKFSASLADVQSQFLLSLFYFVVVSPFALILIMSRICHKKKSNAFHSNLNHMDSMTYALLQG